MWPLNEVVYYRMTKIYYIIATGLGSGYLPKMPGTWGSLVGLILTCFLLSFGKLALFIGLVLVTVIGWYCTHRLIMDEDLGDSDPPFIVIDEIAGMMLTVLIIFWGIELMFGDGEGISTIVTTKGASYIYNGFFDIRETWQLITVLTAFWAFRLLDILKPPPISTIDRRFAYLPQQEAFGIMLDDLAAGLMAGLIILGLVKLL